MQVTKNDQSGLSFIEVMIAMLIMAISVVGIASALSASVSQDTASHLQGLAALEAGIMATDIQTNTAYWSVSTLNETAPTTSSTACNDTACTPAGIADEDIGNWGYLVSQSLPHGQGIIACGNNTSVSPPITVCRVGILWKINQTVTGSEATRVDDQEYYLVVQP